MATIVKGFSLSRISAVDLSASKYLVAKITSTGLIDIATANTDAIIGLIEDGAGPSGSAVSVQFLGTGFAIAGGAINPGDRVTATTAGKVITTVTDKQAIVGRYLGEVAAASGDVIEIMLSPGALLSL